MNKTARLAETCVNEIEKAWKDFSWDNPQHYADWLAQTYYYVRHATRVLAKAASKCRFEQENFHKNLLEGINEEKNHEILAFKDVCHLGFQMYDFPEHPETTAYYQSLYHLLDSDGPFALLGFFLPLEGVGGQGGSWLYDKVVKAYGQKAATFAKVHSKADVDHYQNAVELLKELPSDQLKIIENSLTLSTELYCNILNKITSVQNKKIVKKAA